MPFDQAKWDAITSQWDSDDEAEAADALESDKDAMDLADPKTWSEQDGLARDRAQLAKAFGSAGAPPDDGPDMEPDGDPDDAMAAGAAKVAAEAAQAPTRIRAPSMTSPATAGAGQKDRLASPSPSPVKPAAPLADPSSLDWKGLSERMKAALLAQNSSRGYENMFANIGAQSGYRPNPHAGDVGVDMVKGDVELDKARQGAESHDMAVKGQKAALGVKAAMDDPNSLQSQKAREAVKSMGVQLPRGFDNFSANDIHNFVKTGELATMARAKAADEDRDAKAAAAAKAAAEKSAKAEEALNASRKAFSSELKRRGIDPTTASEKDIDRVLSDLRSRDIAGASHEVAVSNNRLAQAAEGRKEGEAEALKGSIPFAGSELHYTGTGTPREDDRREAQKAAAGYGAAIAGMDDMSGRLSDFAKHPSPATKSALESAARLTAGHLNTAYGQGAMSIDEAREMAKTLGASFDSASGFQFVLDKMMGDDPGAAEVMQRRLKSARQSTMASALAKAKAYHYESQGGGSAGSVKMRFPDGSVHDVAPEKLDKAKLKGGVPVDG